MKDFKAEFEASQDFLSGSSSGEISERFGARGGESERIKAILLPFLREYLFSLQKKQGKRDSGLGRKD